MSNCLKPAGEKMKKLKKVYLVWHEQQTEDEVGYWNIYETIADAVSSEKSKEEDKIEIYEVFPKRIGFYREVTSVKKVKRNDSK